MSIKDDNFFVSDFDEHRMIRIEIGETRQYLNLNDAIQLRNSLTSKSDSEIRLRNFLTEEIERVQKPIAEMLDKVGGNVSPEI